MNDWGLDSLPSSLPLRKARSSSGLLQSGEKRPVLFDIFPALQAGTSRTNSLRLLQFREAVSQNRILSIASAALYVLLADSVEMMGFYGSRYRLSTFNFRKIMIDSSFRTL
jgi:hypothetical protein